MKKLMITLFVAFLGWSAGAQVTVVSLQASGLTCSMCSNAINKSLKTVDFVEKVDANIKTSTFDILIKPGAKVEFDKLKKKVEDAGFFVAKLEATMKFNNVAVVNDGHVVVDGNTFHFIGTSNQTLNGAKTVRLLDKGFV